MLLSANYFSIAHISYVADAHNDYEDAICKCQIREDYFVNPPCREW